MGFQGPVSIEVMPVVPAHALSPIHSPDLPPDASHTRGDSSDLIRAASYTSLPKYTDVPQDGIKRTFSDNVLHLRTQEQPAKVSNSMQNVNAELFRRASRKTKKRMSILGVAPTSHGHDELIAGQESEQPRSMTKTVGGTLKSMTRRRSWMPVRSTSPARKEDSATAKKKTSSSPKKRASFTEHTITIPEPVAIRISSRSPKPDETEHGYFEVQRRSSPSPSSNSRSLTDMNSRNSSATDLHRLSRQSSATSLRSRVSTDGLYLGVPSGHVPPMPKSASSDRLSAVGADIRKKDKDPLWNAFRTVEGEFAAFQAKTSLQKAKTIRTVLLPFLSKHAEAISSLSLRAEDLDRRVHILNKWWTCLLELLNGRGGHSISGTDRPAFLEATTEIMLRPEWRVPPLPKAATAGLNRMTGTFRSTTSTDSDDSDFLLDTIYQNIRNIFVQNLLSQIAFVVDKLSMRSAPASLVNFGGKTCAYAFFFCPGVADVLVRLWHLPSGTLRRIFSEHGTLHNGKGICTPVSLASKFPPPVRSLCFKSQNALARHVQPKAQRPPGSEHIRWYGPWVNRWIGRDSDLFFVFAKYYHLLVADFHPQRVWADERVCIPGFAPVHAQLLVVLQSTIYRHVSHFATDPYQTGDNIDAMAPSPMAIPNATRAMTENRLVMLLRDLVGDNAPNNSCSSELFVSSFEILMKAVTRRVSMYNGDACFVLCDLIEEICPILSRYEQNNPNASTFDSCFWTRVLQQMMQTHTTMTQIRVIALLYSMWNSLAITEELRRNLAIGWILEQQFFRQFFNHWSSMVRHYYLRLLCWRVGRCDGEASELDIEILQTLLTRLNYCWAHHQYLENEAETRQLAPPSSHACSPAPGRALVIVRTDNQSLTTHFSTFDRILASSQPAPSRNHVATLNTIPDIDHAPLAGKKRWSLFRSINPFTSSPGNTRPGEVTPPASPEATVADRRSMKSPPGSAPSSRPSTPPHQALSFKFSLEYTSNRPTLPTKARKLPQPTLSTNSQKLIDDLTLLERLSSEDKPTVTIIPIKPTDEEMMTARYSGRALAEWSQVISECRNFYTRRRQEGCPRDHLIETPMMAVESFRMFG